MSLEVIFKKELQVSLAPRYYGPFPISQRSQFARIIHSEFDRKCQLNLLRFSCIVNQVNSDGRSFICKANGKEFNSHIC